MTIIYSYVLENLVKQNLILYVDTLCDTVNINSVKSVSVIY